MLHVEAFAFFERHIWVYNDINKHMKHTCFLFHRHFNDWSRGKQLILFPEDLNVSQRGVEGNIEIRGKRN